MVIASDGVWEYLENEEVMNIITPYYQKNCIELAADKIVKISAEVWHKMCYSRDDITLIIVILNPFCVYHSEQYK
jgi:serine/threonine protein phosphatase PrpC